MKEPQITQAPNEPALRHEMSLQHDEYSNSSRLHLASGGGPPPDLLLQPGRVLKQKIALKYVFRNNLKTICTICPDIKTNNCNFIRPNV